MSDMWDAELVREVIGQRIRDLDGCGKDDDCATQARGAALALSDLEWRLGGGLERYEAENGIAYDAEGYQILAPSVGKDADNE